MCCWLWVMSGGLGYGQHGCEGRSLSGAGAVGGDLAAMHVDDALDDRQAQASRAFPGGGFGREPLEAAEQPSEILRRQAGALVGDTDHGVVLLMVHHHGDLAA